MKTNAIIILSLTLSAAFCLDTEYSNEQSGVRMKIIGLDSKLPMLRIENKGRFTLAIRNNTSLAVSIYKDNIRVRGNESKEFVVANGARPRNDEVITILSPESNLEIPFRGIYFNIRDEGLGENLNWDEGIAKLNPGSYRIRFSSNGLGLSVLDRNTTPFKVNFDIPEFTYEIGSSK
ncbi:hypothetical protein LBMAG53_00030 [Planctomycetota bacterium]|nr:hypothetical protein LBMAG53_00030 [Planctomycetota bacterium]